jgi:hypothetical protein
VHPAVSGLYVLRVYQFDMFDVAVPLILPLHAQEKMPWCRCGAVKEGQKRHSSTVTFTTFQVTP